MERASFIQIMLNPYQDHAASLGHVTRLYIVSLLPCLAPVSELGVNCGEA